MNVEVGTVGETIRGILAGEAGGFDVNVANALAVATAEAVLHEPTAGIRPRLWNELFATIAELLPGYYQGQDFEIANYALYNLGARLRLFRGPKPSIDAITSGEFAVWVGAAQLFGRFHARNAQALVSETSGVPTLNLSIGGVGPQEFLARDYDDVLSRARVGVVQVMSLRSIACEEYPGDWQTIDPSSGALIPRETLLMRLWKDDRKEYARLVDKYRHLYVESYRALSRKIGGPTCLLYASRRAAHDVRWRDVTGHGVLGTFPHGVTHDLIAEIRPFFDDYVDVVDDD